MAGRNNTSFLLRHLVRSAVGLWTSIFSKAHPTHATVEHHIPNELLMSLVGEIFTGRPQLGILITNYSNSRCLNITILAGGNLFQCKYLVVSTLQVDPTSCFNFFLEVGPIFSDQLVG